MKKAVRQVLFVFGGVATLLVVATLVVILFFGRTPPTPPPNPNGYDDLTKAGQAVRGNLDDLADRDLDSLRALIATNAEALPLLRVGLSRDCSVPTDAVIANFGTAYRDLIALKSLAKLLNAEGRLAEMENRPLDAAQSYLDAVRLGTKMSHGGLMIHRLTGVACEGVGSISLVKLLPKLACDQIRPLVEALEQIDGQAVAWRHVLRNEDRFARAQMGKYPNPIKLLADLWNARGMREYSGERHDLATAHLRLLTVELALRCYRCDEGKAPTDLQRLVPKHLHRIPTDPFSGHPLAYKQNGTNWLLYSVGRDRKDDGGKPVSRISSGGYSIGSGASKSGSEQKNKGDVFYDSPR